MTLQCPCGAMLTISGTRSEVETAAGSFEERHAACPWEVVGVVSAAMVEAMTGGQT